MNTDKDASWLESSKFREKLFDRLHGISSQFDINYMINPKLKYEYPPINPITCQNIVHCLLNTPAFYVQTLHLMNKMNLPCPLVPYVRDQRIKIQISESDDNNVMESESLESEIESENDQHMSKQTDVRLSRKKISSILKTVQLPSRSNTKPVDLKQVFEESSNQSNKPLANRQNKAVKEYDRVVVPSENGQGFAKIVPIGSNLKSTDQSIEASDIETCDSVEFISLAELEKNRISMTELREMPVFRNYERGEKNSRLYVKNLSKKVTDSDLKRIYGRYINWNSESERNSFDIRLMQQGKMKGQAFLTFPNEEIASRALNETNGYVLDQKPLVVQFARSAKPATTD